MKETIAKMIKLARLRFSKEEMDRFAKKAEHIIEYVEKLKQIKTEAIEPTSHATPPPVSGLKARSAGETSGGALEVVNAFRDDQVKRFEAPEKILATAPAKLQNFFEVPKVIE